MCQQTLLLCLAWSGTLRECRLVPDSTSMITWANCEVWMM